MLTFLPERKIFLRYCLLSIIAALLTTLWGYNFGRGDHIEQLPIILRAADPGYLPADWFANASVEFGPRWIYAHLMAALMRLMPLPALAFSLTLLSNTLTALLTGLFTRQWGADDRAGLLSIAAVMTVHTFLLGSGSTLSDTYLSPSLLVIPLLVGCLWAGLTNSPLICAALAGLGACIHPLMGLETGAILLTVCTLGMWKNGRKAWLRLGAGWGLFALITLLALLPYRFQAKIPDKEFIFLVAFFRHPHHYLPSTFAWQQYAQAILFVLAVVFAWLVIRKDQAHLKHMDSRLVCLSGILVVLMLAGYVGVEVYPIRLLVTAQVFRLLYIAKWLGLVILTVFAALQLKKGWPGWLNVIALLSAPAAAVTSGLGWLNSRLKQPLTAPVMAAMTAVGVLIGFGLFLPDVAATLFYLLLVITAAGLAERSLKRLTVWVGLGGCGVALVLLLSGQAWLPSSIAQYISWPVFTLKQVDTPGRDVAAYASQFTPADAVFLTPPSMGEFRYLADRAIMVDFSAFPFQDAAMHSWYVRLTSAYGMPSERGWAAAVSMTYEYRRISDKSVGSLAKRFGFDYAVMYNETKTAYPVLFKGKDYKLVLVKH
jgi:hypothetical protein